MPLDMYLPSCRFPSCVVPPERLRATEVCVLAFDQHTTATSEQYIFHHVPLHNYYEASVDAIQALLDVIGLSS